MIRPNGDLIEFDIDFFIVQLALAELFRNIWRVEFSVSSAVPSLFRGGGSKASKIRFFCPISSLTGNFLHLLLTQQAHRRVRQVRTMDSTSRPT